MKASRMTDGPAYIVFVLALVLALVLLIVSQCGRAQAQPKPSMPTEPQLYGGVVRQSLERCHQDAARELAALLAEQAKLRAEIESLKAKAEPPKP